MARRDIFISYRRGDAAGYAGRLYDGLSARFGAERIFMDVDAIEPGADFVQRIAEVLGECRVLLVVIGSEWLQARDSAGNRRLDAPQDFVRTEIETALSHDIRVIPVLTQDTPMPTVEQLPESLATLARRNAIELSDVRWHYDLGRLLDFLETVPDDVDTEPEGPGGAVPPRSAHRAHGQSRRPWSRRRIHPPAIRNRLAVAATATVGIVAVASIFLLRGWADPGGPGNPLNERIAFISGRDGGRELWSMRADASDLVRLTHDGSEALRADWSPDGKRIAFTSDRDGDFDIWVMNANGSGLRQITDHPGVESAPHWSPDGRRFVFGSERDGNDSEIWTVDIDGTDLKQLTDNEADDDTPDWSKRGRIAFESDRDGDYDIYTVDEKGKNPFRVTSNDFNDFWPDWSPDGKRIAFRSNADGDYDVYSVAADGSGLRKLSFNKADDHRPAWSSDGSFVFFDSNMKGDRDIYGTTAKGTRIRQITDNPADDFSVAVRPSR